MLINVIIFGMVFSGLPKARHSGSREGDYTVWHLIAEIEAERQAAQEESGIRRHRLREPT
ncbi:hypothetical protein [Saccharopolyspora spinosa]|uniref:Uncharacterized protein n=1 Tax=Saccharopolyspora spinosa TaxID=60894 RepID=A0A2N3XVT9_SACSN|nr:hypothetical protein [Saccharopolyspora spinosa]PKW14803.1 hypothetical protein A8926_2452 [Saccharopolyspora spinosa]